MDVSRIEGAADLLIVGAEIWDGRHLPGSDAIAIADGRILAVDRSAELKG